jgi:hypothetical protein
VSVGLFLGCNSEVVGPEFNRPKLGAFYTYIGDAPVCDVLAFRSNITGLKLRRTDDPEEFETLFPTASLFLSIKVDFAGLRDFSTIMDLRSATVASYDQAVLTLQSPQIVVYDPASDPPVKVISGVLSTSTPAVPLPSGYGIVSDKLNVLRFDFDMLKSLELDADGQVSGNITPVLSATPVSETASEGFGYFDNLVGFVMTVSPNPVGAFKGSFTLQLLSGSGPAITVNVKDEKDLFGVPDLKSLETGRVLEVIAKVDTSGNIVAEHVEVEDRAIVEEKRIAFIGTVLPTPVRDASGNVTQFKLFVRAEEPDMSREVPLNSIVTVNVSPSTYFQISARPANFVNMTFDPSSIAVGEELVVHGQYTLITDEPAVVEANSIYLKVQTMQGGLAELLNVGSDGKTGAFRLGTCSTLLQSTPVIVVTNSQTAFLNVFGLAEISPQATLLVRGLPFFVKEATVVRDTPVPAGSMVMVARQIHQLQ